MILANHYKLAAQLPLLSRLTIDSRTEAHCFPSTIGDDTTVPPFQQLRSTDPVHDGYHNLASTCMPTAGIQLQCSAELGEVIAARLQHGELTAVTSTDISSSYLQILSPQHQSKDALMRHPLDAFQTVTPTATVLTACKIARLTCHRQKRH
jgi:hypothetical protein